MTIPSPLQDVLEGYEVQYSVPENSPIRDGSATGKFQPDLLCEFLPWGDAGCFVLATTGIVELEYAALQKNAGIFDAACRGTIELRGEDRLECLNRLVTQQLIDLKVGDSELAFLTSRKGAVIADVIVHVLEGSLLLDIDCTVVAQICDHINSYIVTEDVQVQNITESAHWLWIIGPESYKYASENSKSFQLPFFFLGLRGIAIAASSDDVVEMWKAIVQQGVRPVGWYALNMARVERGSPMFMIDFDAHNLPHETSLIQSRVKFDKGCYLGQEIVARMESLGKPKQRLVQLRLKCDELPVAGSQVWENETGSGTPIGVVTSSAISPMLGGVPCIFAMVRKKNAKIHTEVFLYVGETIIGAEILELESLNKVDSE